MRQKNTTEKARRLLQERGVRITLARVKVLLSAQSIAKSIFSVEDIYQDLLGQGNAMARSSVSNTLNAFLKMHLLIKQPSPTKTLLFCLNPLLETAT